MKLGLSVKALKETFIADKRVVSWIVKSTAVWG